MRVAVDAMGGDHAPRELLAGSLAAAQADPDLAVLVVGPREVLEPELADLGGAPQNLSMVHASQVITMDAKPVVALKKFPDASILRAIQLVKEDRADAVVAAGSTGAAVAASLMTLKRLPGVRRPGIAIPIPADNARGCCLLIDAGANPDSKAEHLAQYGVMGACYYTDYFGLANPRVGIVSIGAEESKGNLLVRDAAQRLKTGHLNFVGNVEGRDLFGGACEVAVADGFVGNIILKSMEGFAEMLTKTVTTSLGNRAPEVLKDLARRIDYAEWGGAPLLGVNGLVMICHGHSDRRAIANAVTGAARAVGNHINEHILRGLSPAETETA